MKACPKCYSFGEPGDKFCDIDGELLVDRRSCQSCDGGLRVGARFCPNCGKPVPERGDGHDKN